MTDALIATGLILLCPLLVWLGLRVMDKEKDEPPRDPGSFP